MKFLEPVKNVTLVLACGLFLTDLNVSRAGIPAVDSTHQVAAAEVDRTGYLLVFSKTEELPVGESLYSNPHTDYVIYNSAGKRFRSVRNGGPNDEQPEKIALPTGKYIVQAQSDYVGTVRIPVVIKTGLQTSLYLEKPNRKAALRGKAIRLSNGDIAGYAIN